MSRRRKSYTLKRRTRTYKKRSTAIKRIKRKMRITVFAVVSVVLSVIVLVSISVVRFVQAPFSSASNINYQDSERVWHEDSTNLILIQLNDVNDPSSEIEKLAIINFDVSTSRYSIYILPVVDIEVDYALNYGRGRLSDVYKVGSADQNRGIYLLEKTLARMLAIKTDGYVAIDADGLEEIAGQVRGVDTNDLSTALRLRNAVSLPGAVSSFRNVALTNLKLADIFEILRFVHNTSETSSSVIHVNRYQLTDPDKWDAIWQSRLDVSDVKKESVKVFVANASNNPKIPGLAGWGGRVAKNIGADVLDTQNSFVDFKENTIITSDTNLVTVHKLAEALGIANIVRIEDVDRQLGYNPQVYRTKVSLFLTSY